jgi:endonuclease/exonuclease/phosphatase family metal-dependent hydrolase
MKLVTYNIRYGVGIDDTLDLPRIASEVQGADIIGLQEVDRFFKRGGEVDQAAELAELLGDYHWVYGAGQDTDGSYRTAEGKLVNRRRQHGEMILSRYPILSTRTYPIPKMGSITRHAVQHVLLEAVIDAPGGALRVYNTHLFYWSPDWATKQAQFIRDRILAAPGEGGAWCGDPAIIDDHWQNGAPPPPMPRDVILMGDLNSGVETSVYETFVGPKSMEGGRVQTLDGFVDPWVWLGQEEDTGKTAHFDTRRIDHILVGASLRHRIKRFHIDEAARGSDHLPVWLELSDKAGE